MPTLRKPVVAAILALVAACQPPPDGEAAGEQPCQPPDATAALPDAIRESSGVAASRRHAGIFWTHNDSGWPAELFAIDSTGAIVARVRVDGADNRDWEDIELAPCEPGDPTDCLFIGDIGDNDERYDTVFVYRIPEPDPSADSVSATATVIRAIYQDGPRDAEAMFVTERGLYILNKGRSHAIDLYRIPPPYDDGRVHVLTPIQRIAPPPTSISAQVTAAAAHGVDVVVRSYGGIRFFEFHADSLRHASPYIDLVVPEQRQGEGVDFAADGRLVLTSEEAGSQPAHLALIRCVNRGPGGTGDAL